MLFLLVFYLHGTSPVTTAHTDSRWSIPTAHSLIHEGNWDLSEFESELSKSQDYCIYRASGIPYNLFPPISSLIAVPFVALFEIAPHFTSTILPGMKPVSSLEKPLSALAVRDRLERAAASFVIALTAIVIFFIGLTRLPIIAALILALIFSFATSAWSVASRSLWQHGPSMLFVSLSLLWTMRKAEKPVETYLTSIALALAYIARPTNAPFVLLCGIYNLFYKRTSPTRLILPALLIFALFVTWSYSNFQFLLPPYYHPTRLEGFATFPEALAGNLISPARGLFIYSPVFLFSLWGFILLLRDKAERPLALVLSASCLFHWISISLFPHWWGGHAYGPRLMSDLIPLLMVGLIPVLTELHNQIKSKRVVRSVFFVSAVALSVTIHCRGAYSKETTRWDRWPVNVDKQPSRVWDWNDPPFLRDKETLK